MCPALPSEHRQQEGMGLATQNWTWVLSNKMVVTCGALEGRLPAVLDFLGT